MDEIQTIDEIRSRYDSEWVLVDQPQIDEMQEVLGGRVRYHSKDRDELYRKIAELDVKESAIVYTGTIPEDMEFIL